MFVARPKLSGKLKDEKPPESGEQVIVTPPALTDFFQDFVELQLDTPADKIKATKVKPKPRVKNIQKELLLTDLVDVKLNDTSLMLPKSPQNSVIRWLKSIWNSKPPTPKQQSVAEEQSKNTYDRLS